jgi:hypothetical protein
MEICEHCGGTISDSETPWVWEDRIVCRECHYKLGASRRSPAAEASPPIPAERAKPVAAPIVSSEITDLPKARLLMLSKFLPPGHADDFGDYWDAALGEPATRAVAKLAARGYIEPCSIEARAQIVFTGAKLKELLKERHLPVSGKKAEQIKRLMEHDRLLLVDLTKDVVAFQCTATGSTIALRFKNEQAAEREEAEKAVLDLLRQREFTGAATRMAVYEASQVFPRGMGIDWSRYNPSPDVEALRHIFAKIPTILNGLNPDCIEHLRVAAAMSMLWGTKESRSWLPDGIRIDRY